MGDRYPLTTFSLKPMPVIKTLSAAALIERLANGEGFMIRDPFDDGVWHRAVKGAIIPFPLVKEAASISVLECRPKCVMQNYLYFPDSAVDCISREAMAVKDVPHGDDVYLFSITKRIEGGG